MKYLIPIILIFAAACEPVNPDPLGPFYEQMSLAGFDHVELKPPVWEEMIDGQACPAAAARDGRSFYIYNQEGKWVERHFVELDGCKSCELKWHTEAEQMTWVCGDSAGFCAHSSVRSEYE